MGERFARAIDGPTLEVIPVVPRGYCHGVVTAMNMARELAKQYPGPKYMLGYLVHNEHMTSELQELGITLVDFDDRLEGLDEIHEGTDMVENRLADVGETKAYKLATSCSFCMINFHSGKGKVKETEELEIEDVASILNKSID